MLAPTLGALAMLAGVLTTWVVNTRPASEQDPDARFWYVFTGAWVVAPLVLGASVIDRGIGVATVAAVAGTVLAANKYSSRVFRRRVDAEHQSILAAEHSALAARHESVLRAWSRYELDPEAAINHPSMNDVGSPPTAALVRALAAAEDLRLQHPEQESGGVDAGYRQAVIELETAFRQAELAETRVPAIVEAPSLRTSRTSPQPQAGAC
ncbi:hypothetical protein [Paeniglutamicibacter psychrophenolicus]|uniref:DUF4129 domain-containing protein n=1 Tax=Paeniglutamicibacter psychrophenolicus TaxID=257454 RepID=A0ABS4WFH6_9MICC|nr:hypothetical protein [Paeniglutamicibacter psychrophenolicus]MBP2374969.1 hypothetical protein [Paeniglutamicibacter psychrophenolicus]